MTTATPLINPVAVPAIGERARPPFPLGAAVVGGFGSAVALWSMWFITHLPWIGLPEIVATPLTLAAWAIALTVFGLALGLRANSDSRWSEAVPAAVGAGVFSALLGLLMLGTKLTEAAPHTFEDRTALVSIKPNAGLIALGFILLGALVGLVFGTTGALIRGVRTLDEGSIADQPWLSRMALVVCAAAAPLLVIGGLVTSQNAGMAVPDWPNTYGTNMFLYPLGPHAQAEMGPEYPKIFLEHTHRLFGTLLGLASLTLMGWTIAASRRGKVGRAVQYWAIAAFVLVCIQGILGGMRVRMGDVAFDQDSHMLRMLHGVLAQVVFGLFVVVAVLLSTAYATFWETQAHKVRTFPDFPWRRAKSLTNAALHVLLLQLLLGAAYRHMRHDHILYTHIAFSLVAVVMVGIGGAIAAGAPAGGGPLARSLARAGILAAAVGILQFALGWLAWLAGGKGPDPETIGQSLIRTAHQANGAALLAVIVWAAVASRPLAKAIGPKRKGPPAPASTHAPTTDAPAPTT